MPEFRSGDVFANHRIEGLAGRGGMGVVYRATDLDLDRLVALKVIAPALAEEPDFRARFVAESKAAASIEHPHVIPVYYAGEREGVLFIVMRFVDGPDLRALVRAQGPLEPERAAQIVAQVAGALDAAHANGLVHRDVKPANVLLGEGDHAYLTDFGLTKREASTGGVSRTGSWVGTLGFVAPEQIRGERVDARTDVYALGCVLVHALTGSAPYVRESDEATLWAHLNAPPPTDSVAEEFRDVVARALSKDPADRFPSAGDLGRAALAAAGRSAAPGPERNVARGAAAPEGTPQTAPTARVGLAAHEGETHASPPEFGETAVTARGGDGGRGARGRRRLTLAFAGLLAAAGAIAALALAGGEEDPVAPDGGATTATSDAQLPAAAGRMRRIAARPNAITIANGRVWVLANSESTIAVLDAGRTGQLKQRVRIRAGGTALATGRGSVWALKYTRSLLRFDARTASRIGTAATIGVAGVPNNLAIGAGAIWVVVAKKGRRDGSGESLVKLDPDLRTPSQEAIPVPGGAQSVAVGEGAVWVSNPFSSSILRVDPANLRNTRKIRVGTQPNGLAVGHGAVWVAAAGDKSVTRIDARTRKRRTISLGVRPTRVAVGGGSVWVTAEEANQLIRIDPKRRRVRERIGTGAGPYALDVTNGHAVWVTLLDDGGGAVQRVRFHP